MKEMSKKSVAMYVCRPGIEDDRRNGGRLQRKESAMKHNLRDSYRVIVAFSIVVGLMAMSASPVWAKNPKLGVIPLQAKAYGMFGETAAATATLGTAVSTQDGLLMGADDKSDLVLEGNSLCAAPGQ